MKDIGIETGSVKLNLKKMMAFKDEVVDANTKGVEFLFKKNKITWAKGYGTLQPGNVVEVIGADGTISFWQGQSVIIATGSVPVQLPFLKFDEQRVHWERRSGDRK